MKFEDVHGVDWDFYGPEGEFETFSVSGYGANDRKEAEEFERAHPTWKKEVVRF